MEPAKSTTPTTDGGFVSGHTAEAVRDGLAVGYEVPERFQEMVARLLGFQAKDSWRNDIVGTGKLSKTGAGALRLGGKDSDSGGPQPVAGTLQADSARATSTSAAARWSAMRTRW